MLTLRLLFLFPIDFVRLFLLFMLLFYLLGDHSLEKFLFDNNCHSCVIPICDGALFCDEKH